MKLKKLDIDDCLSQWLAYSISLLFLTLQFFLQTAFTVFVTPLMHDFQIGEVQASTLFSVFFYSYIFCLIPAGFMLDYIGSRKSILLAIASLAVGCFVFGYSHDFVVAAMGRCIIGAASAFAFITLLYVTNLWFSHNKFALMVGLGETISIFAATIGSIFLPKPIFHFGWRFIFTTWGWINIVLFFVALLFFKDHKKESRDKKNRDKKIDLRPYLALLKDTQIWILGMYGLFAYSSFTVFNSLWGVPFLMNVYHYNSQNATTAVMMTHFGEGFGCLLMGIVSSKTHNTKLLMLLSALLATVCLFPVTYLLFIPYLLLCVLLFFCGFFSVAYMQSYTIAQKNYPAASHGVTMSFITIIIMGGAPLLQILLGGLLESRFFRLAKDNQEAFHLSFLVLPVFFLLSFVFALKIQKRNSE